MGWWKADPVPDPQSSNPPPSQVAARIAPPPPPSPPSDPASACPVDPKTREIWLQQAQSKSQPSNLPPSHPPLPAQTKQPPQLPTLNSSKECSSDKIDQSLSTPPSSTASTATPTRPLSNDRVISSIPRAFTHPTSSASKPTTPANAEFESGPHTSGNWIYPSESQFFHAVMRKGSATTSTPEALASSMSAIIPIHNAVNERAWHLIKQWEGNSSARCGGPKLLSFQGLGAGALSPKARIKTLMGYTEPFDRHDWVVERCGGEQVEYVIDFYQGKAAAGEQGNGNQLNFYLDVRPKLNSFEGWRMRGERLVGMR